MYFQQIKYVEKKGLRTLQMHSARSEYNTSILVSSSSRTASCRQSVYWYVVEYIVLKVNRDVRCGCVVSVVVSCGVLWCCGVVCFGVFWWGCSCAPWLTLFNEENVGIFF